MDDGARRRGDVKGGAVLRTKALALDLDEIGQAGETPLDLAPFGHEAAAVAQKGLFVLFLSQGSQLGADNALGTAVGGALDAAKRRHRVAEAAEHCGHWNIHPGNDFADGRAAMDLLEGQTALNLQVAQLVVDEGGCVHASAAYGSDQGVSEKIPIGHAAKALSATDGLKSMTSESGGLAI